MTTNFERRTGVPPVSKSESGETPDLRDYFYTIPGQAYTKLLSRVWEHPGCIVDLGCAGWDWSGCFLGKKRVVGADPLERARDDFTVDCERGLVGPVDGAIYFQEDGEKSTAFHIEKARSSDRLGKGLMAMVSWKTFCVDYRIDEIAALKINIEGGEWPLLASMDADDFAKIDQLAVSFHDWRWQGMRKATEASLFMLHQLGFTGEQICQQYGWWLFTK